LVRPWPRSKGEREREWAVVVTCREKREIEKRRERDGERERDREREWAAVVTLRNRREREGERER
jgi:hypothetical protein